jgi:hypothetical protein
VERFLPNLPVCQEEKTRSGFHADAIRIPMMAIAVIGSLVNLYAIWRIRIPRWQAFWHWRMHPVTNK